MRRTGLCRRRAARGRQLREPSTAWALPGSRVIWSIPYLKANIEGGQYFNWFYNDSNNLGIGFDPNGTDLRVSLPEGDRLAQSRNAYSANQQLLANKQLRWWWNNQHQAIYANCKRRLGAARAAYGMGTATRSRSFSPSTAFRRATKAPISRMSSTIRTRPKATRRSGRSGTRARASPAITGRGATMICCICSRCRRSTNIG